jgi:hypothetical protein
MITKPTVAIARYQRRKTSRDMLSVTIDDVELIVEENP